MEEEGGGGGWGVGGWGVGGGGLGGGGWGRLLCPIFCGKTADRSVNAESLTTPLPLRYTFTAAHQYS